MKLPKKFKNWTKFAIYCSNKFPGAEKIKVIEDEKEITYPIELIKANAFDEITKERFDVEAVRELKITLEAFRTPYLSQYDLKSMLDLLFLLSVKS